MNISVEELTSVDKEIKISATREDLAPKFNEAFKKYKDQINLPGFRPGKVPLELVRKRFGKEIEQEEIGKYVREVFEEKVVPEYEPVGESQMIDLIWENDELEAKFKIGSRPEFELADLGKIKVDKMIHDVTDDEVNEEIDRALEQAGDWEETGGTVTEKSRVTVDALHLDDEGNLVEGEKDENQVIEMKREEYKSFSGSLVGKKVGDEVDVELGEGEEKEQFRLAVKKVEEVIKPDLTDEFVKNQTNGEAKNVDEYRSLLLSRIQNYYDQSATDLFRSDVVDELVEAHSLEVPEVFVEQVQNQYVEQVRQQNQGELPPDFDEDEYKEKVKSRVIRDCKWFFINEKLQEKFDDIEIKPDDIDEHLTAEAARYGITVDQMRNLFAQNPQQLENLRTSIREKKIFDKLGDVVTIREISKEKYRQEYEKKIDRRKKEEGSKEKKKFWNIFS